MKWLHERLEAAITRTGLTKEQFADRIKVSRPTLYSWLNGSVPKGIHLMRISSFLGIGISELFGEIETVRTSLPMYHNRGKSVAKPEMKAATERITDLYKDLFADDSVNPLQAVVISRDPQTAASVADSFRRIMAVGGDESPNLRHVLALMHKLGVTVIPRSFPDVILADAFYVLMGCAKVIFVNRVHTCDELASSLVHEVVHSLRAAVTSELSEAELIAEESYCDEIARLVMRGTRRPNGNTLDNVLFGSGESIGFIEKLESHFPLWYAKVKKLVGKASVSRLAEVLDIAEEDANAFARNVGCRNAELD